MKEASSDGEESLVIIARAVKTRGLKGALVAEVLTDFPERFSGISSLIAVSPGGERQVVELESYWFHQDRVVLKLNGYDTIETARGFVDYQFAVPESEQVELAEGYFYDWQLEGCLVETVGGGRVGQVSEVLRFGGGIEMLAVEGVEHQKCLIPMVESIVVEIDVANQRIRIDPPEGLLDL
ncbi:MAG: ribosome maturation factor RimM [Pyrinomonadaceae bacterium]